MGRFLLTILAALLYALGWLWGGVVSVALWMWSALAVGYADARRLASRPRPSEGRGRATTEAPRGSVPAIDGVPVRPVI